LSGKIKPRVQSLFKVRAFLNRQPKTRGWIGLVSYVPLSSNNPNGRRGKRVWLTACLFVDFAMAGEETGEPEKRKALESI
jgi:hypothetical protein